MECYISFALGKSPFRQNIKLTTLLEYSQFDRKVRVTAVRIPEESKKMLKLQKQYKCSLVIYSYLESVLKLRAETTAIKNTSQQLLVLFFKIVCSGSLMKYIRYNRYMPNHYPGKPGVFIIYFDVSNQDRSSMVQPFPIEGSNEPILTSIYLIFQTIKRLYSVGEFGITPMYSRFT